MFNFTAVFFLLFYYLVSRYWSPRFENWPLRRVLVLTTASLAIYYVAVSMAYALSPSYMDHLEASVAMKALLASAGQPIYTSLTAPARISLLYGPSTYLAGMAFGRLPIDAILASKLAGAALPLCGLTIFALTLRRFFRGAGWIACVGYCILVVLLFRHISFWNRPDSAILFGVALVCSGVFTRNRYLSVLLVSLGAAFAMDAKGHALLYVLPLAPIYVSRMGFKTAAVSCVGTVVLALAPFLIFSAFSLTNYIAWLQMAATHNLRLILFLETISLFIVASIPVGVVAWTFWKSGEFSRTGNGAARLSIYAYFGCGLLVSIVASKAQAGSHHILPFAPVMAAIAVWVNSRTSPVGRRTVFDRAGNRRLILSLAMAFSLVMLVGLHKSQARVIRFMQIDRHHIMREELLSIKEAYPTYQIVMGYSDHDNFEASFLRPLLFDTGGREFMDASALMDMGASGLTLPVGTLELMRSQVVEIFVLPRGEAPFYMGNFYRGQHELFGSGLRSVFLDNYHQVDSSSFYTVWMANRL